MYTSAKQNMAMETTPSFLVNTIEKKKDTYPHLYLTTHNGTSPTLPASPPADPAPPAAPPPQLAPFLCFAGRPFHIVGFFSGPKFRQETHHGLNLDP